AAGDFITGPEISQMFGELLGLALAQTWLHQGAPGRIVLAELGPGRGTLMADLLRATRGVPGFHAALQVCLVEASPVLRARQRAALGHHAVIWLDQAADLPVGPLYLIANEFFDALPIRQFQREGTGWRERMVGSGLRLGLSPVMQVAGLPPVPQGEIVELCPAAPAIMTGIAGRIAQAGGVALILDYGGWGTRGDTFQALRANAFADPFADPGQADLTAHVDFAALAAGLPVSHAYVTQGQFLRALGIEARARRLGERLQGAVLQSHLAATRRLTDDAEMGTLFKLLALYPHNCPPPAGIG
ncbi:MAG: SAM-dependent methyltransferase, partial [Candidatus Saccharibacteria bacterium]|nr:SAM-dependent methyltransferase [Pseudorhodobacter sp.]